MDEPTAKDQERKSPTWSHEALHRDISLANQYRLEFIKHSMSLAAGVFVFTVTFRKDIVGTGTPQDAHFLAIGWIALLFSLLGGLGHMAGWDRFYISYRDYKTDLEGGKKARDNITFLRRIAMGVQLLGFFIGVGFVAAFCIVNV